jgi:hypothetical protein
MKNGKTKLASDELRPEYDLATLGSGTRGKHLQAYRAGTNLALLTPEVRKAFPTDAAVNRALRSLMKQTKPGRTAR